MVVVAGSGAGVVVVVLEEVRGLSVVQSLVVLAAATGVVAGLSVVQLLVVLAVAAEVVVVLLLVVLLEVLVVGVVVVGVVVVLLLLSILSTRLARLEVNEEGMGQGHSPGWVMSGASPVSQSRRRRKLPRKLATNSSRASMLTQLLNI